MPAFPVIGLTLIYGHLTTSPDAAGQHIEREFRAKISA
jgi:hypothetical protein